MIEKKIYSNVKLGRNTAIGDFVILGIPKDDDKGRNTQTIIGNGATIRSHTIIYTGNKIGDNFQTGHHVLIRENNHIGNNVSIGSGSDIAFNIEIGNNVRIHSNAFISEFSIIEENCWIGPNVVFTNTLHPLCPKAKECMRGPIIKKGAKIGANSTLLPNIVVGKDSLIGAGSIVTKDVPSRKVVLGNPANVVKSIDELDCIFNLIERPYL